MNLFKTLGYLNLITKCFYRSNIFCNADKVNLLNNFLVSRKFFNTNNSLKETFKAVTKMKKIPEWVSEKTVQHPAYIHVDQKYNTDYDFVLNVYEHKEAKTQVFSITTNDPLDVEKGFVFYVKTIPHNDYGIPHILEHTVLSSSKKYPANPFTVLMQGSLYTLLNAYTYSDRTLYLARSMNKKDFMNIFDVYMDAVLQPLVLENKYIFHTEGWFFELLEMTEEERKDSSVPKINEYRIGYNGIVYNEMKGVLSNPLRVLQYEAMIHLFPENVYSKVSGGHPKVIPMLSYEEFKKFYMKNYSPKKIKVMVSGNDNNSDVLNFVDKYLKDIDLSKYRDDEVEEVQMQKYIQGPMYVVKNFPDTQPQKENLVYISWVMNPEKRNPEDPDLSLKEPVNYYIMEVLNYLLINTPTSVLYKALVQSGLGTGVIDDGMEDELVQFTFSVGLKGITEKGNEEEKEGEDGSKEESKKKKTKVDLNTVHYEVERVVIDALEKVVEEGFNKSVVEAAINNIEYKLKNANLQSSKSTEFMLDMIAKVNYNRDPLCGFEYHKHLGEIKEKVEKIPNFLENYVKKHFLENKHRVVVFLKGDENMQKEEAKKDQELLKERIDKMSDIEKKEVLQDYVELQRHKTKPDSPEALEHFPILSINDLNKKTFEIPVKVFFTNGNRTDYLQEYERVKNDSALSERTMEYFKNNFVLRKSETQSGVNKIEGIDEHDIPVLVHEVSTDGIIFVQLELSLNEFTLEELCYFKLLKALMLENRTLKRSEEEFIFMKEANIGKLFASVETHGRANHLNVINRFDNFALFNFEIHFLNHKSEEAINIALEGLKESDFSNKEKVLELLNRFIDMYKSAFTNDAFFILLNCLKAHFTSKGYINNSMNGYMNYIKLREILEVAKNDFSRVQNTLERLREKLLRSKGVIINITADSESLNVLFNKSKSSFQKLLSGFTNDIKKNSVIQWNEEIKSKGLLDEPDKKEMFVIPTLVNYVGMAGKLLNENEFLNPSYLVIVSALKNSYLWTNVRELNGAYGVVSKISYDGDLLFMSYRDPNLEKTLQVYRESVKGVRDMADAMTDKDLSRYIIYVIRSLDAPRRGIELGRLSFERIITNQTEEDRVEFRKRVMNTTKQDFYDFANLLEKKLNEIERNIIAITNEENAERMINANPKFKKISLE